jgi:hypothetical protein
MTENVSRTRDDLVARLKRAGELQVSGDNQAELDSYFNTRQFRFHGPDGFETDYAGLANYFKAIRAAFDDRSIRRGIIVAEANYIACQTWIEGTFVREFTESPAGALVPNGRRVVWDRACQQYQRKRTILNSADVVSSCFVRGHHELRIVRRPLAGPRFF